jgi:hypothetical protein
MAQPALIIKMAKAVTIRENSMVVAENDSLRSEAGDKLFLLCTLWQSLAWAA